MSLLVDLAEADLWRTFLSRGDRFVVEFAQQVIGALEDLACD
jgi:hypothetical protein